MLQVLGILAFAGGAAAAVAVVFISIAPQWRRIVALATGHPEVQFAPLADLVRAERRIAVRRWAAAGRSAVVQERRRGAA